MDLVAIGLSGGLTAPSATIDPMPFTDRCLPLSALGSVNHQDCILDGEVLQWNNEVS
jgi:hypothetical protein